MKRRLIRLPLAILILLVAATALVMSVNVYRDRPDEEMRDTASPDSPSATAETQQPDPPWPSFTPLPTIVTPPDERHTPDETDEPEEPEQEPEEPGIPDFEPYCIESTDPQLFLASTGIMADGAIVEEYTREEPIDFGYGEDYHELEGIITFRGNNFRDTAAYGYADVRNGKLDKIWSYGTGSYTASDGAVWSGNGWTGQPLIVKWPKETREIMNMHDWARGQEELVEVVYATMDGYVYFTELDTGKATRNRLYLGFPFKGSGSLDPRGYPLLYVGAGLAGANGAARCLVVSLIDGSVLYSFASRDGFAPRGWDAADGAPLVDAETDTLIYPCENGVIYFIKLGSEYDVEAGTMTIDPQAPAKWRYFGTRSHVNGKYWLGMESSAAIWRGHLFISDNGGNLICLDMNTLEVVWVQDVLDDTNCSPALELEDGHPYIYISTSFHGGWRAPMSSSAIVPMWKVDALTGEIVWQTDFKCYTSSGVSGGVQATAAIGKGSLGDLVFVPFARTPTAGAGVLAAFDKATGEVVWEYQTATYAWSSPVCIYRPDGKGYLIYCTADGRMRLLDGLTGEQLDSIPLDGTIEASPAVYGNVAVIGTRSNKAWGVRIT